MRRSLFVLAALAAGLAVPVSSPTQTVATEAAKAPAKKDQDLIKGSWEAVKREVEKKTSRGPFREVAWVFSGDEITMLNKDNKEWAKFKFVLDGAKKPKTIKMTGTDDNNKGKVFYAIYRIEGDTLMMTISPDAFPKEFGGPGKKTGLLTLKRMKS